MISLIIKNSLWVEARHTMERLRKSTFFRNVLIVMSGTATAQAIGFALSPIISRLFSPSDFGVFGSFSSVLGVIAAGITLQYPQAIMLPKERENAINLFFVSALSTFLIAILCLLFCLLAPSIVNGLMKTEGYWALTLLVLASVVSGLNQSCQAWSVRVKAFKHTSASQVIRSFSSNGMQIAFGYFGGGPVGLVASTILAEVVASLNLLRVLIPDFLALRRSVRWSRMKVLAREYVDFPLYSASQNVLNALSSGLPVLLLTHFYGIAVAGAYAFAMRILQVPMGFVLGALRQVLFQKASEMHHEGKSLAPLYIRTTTGLFAIGILPSIALFVWAPELFKWIFGQQWSMAGEFSRILVLWLLFVFCNLPAVLFARIIRFQRFVFFYDLVLLTGRLLALIAGGLYLLKFRTPFQ